MAVSLKDIVAEAPDFIKVIEDGVALAAAVASGNVIAIVTNAANLSQWEQDVVRVYNDIKMISTGTTPTPGA